MNKYFLAGFIAGEGCFGSNDKKKWFQFAIDVHLRDKSILVEIQKLLGGGTVKTFSSRPNMVRYQIGGIYQCREKVIPFCEKYLIASYKKEQFNKWKEKILQYPLKRRPKYNLSIFRKLST